MAFEIVFVALFAIATLVALAARSLKIPYTVALVVTGLALGATHALEPPHLTKELLYAIILPGLLFEAAFHLEFRHFWENKVAINALAVPGVVAATVLTAVLLAPAANALHFVDGFTIIHGLVFGALIAATDPIAVVSLFKSVGAPRRLTVLIEGESLLNDGTAIVLFTVMVAVATGASSSVGAAAWTFVKVVGLGLLVGGAVGYAISMVIQRVDSPMIEITLTTIAAYGSFVAAEHLHASGVIATVVAGMLCGNYAARTGMRPATRIAVESFWEYITFALNSIVFLLIGFEIRLGALAAAWQPILAAYLAVTLGRAAIIFLVTALLGRSRERLPWSWSAALTWGGLRGGLSMVLALGLPAAFPHRDLLVVMTFGVVLLSIVIQGLSMPFVLRRLGIGGRSAERDRYELQHGALLAANAALHEHDRMARERIAHPHMLAMLRAEYEQRAEQAESAILALQAETVALREAELASARRQLLLAEKQGLIDAHHRGLVGQEAFDQLVAEVDERLIRAEHPSAPAAAEPGPAEAAGGEGPQK